MSWDRKPGSGRLPSARRASGASGTTHLLSGASRTYGKPAARSIWKKGKGKSRLESELLFVCFKKKKSQGWNLHTRNCRDVCFPCTHQTCLGTGSRADPGQRWCFRVIAAASLIFLTNGFHLFRKGSLFKTELEITGGKTTKSRGER